MQAHQHIKQNYIAPLLWRSVLNHSEEWTKSFVYQPHLEAPTENKINHQSYYSNQNKNELYLLDIYIYILLTSTITEVANCYWSLWLIAFLFLSILCFVDIACKCRCNSSCSFLATDSQRDALADKARAYLFP